MRNRAARWSSLSYLLLLLWALDAEAQPVWARPRPSSPISCNGGVFVWPPTNVGAGATSAAFANPDEIGITPPFAQTTCYSLMGRPVRGLTIFPSPHLVVTDRPSLWWISGAVVREQVLTGTAGSAPVFAAAHDCFGSIEEVFVITDKAFHILVGGQIFTYSLPAPPVAAGIVTQDAPGFSTCEAVVQCDNDPGAPGVQIWAQLGGVNRVTNIATDPVAPVAMVNACHSPGDTIVACAAAVVFEANQVTVIQGGGATVHALSGTYAGFNPTFGGINVLLTNGGTDFIPLACPSSAVPNSVPLGANGFMAALNCPGSRSTSFASPPPIH